MSDLENGGAQHGNVWLLLPWYVNDTLETAERRLVDDHLAACPSCREELARCKGLAAALRDRPESAPSPHPIQLARLLERVEASERGFEALSRLGEPDERTQDGEDRGQGAAAGGAAAALPARPAGGSAARHDRRFQAGRPGSQLLRSTPRPIRWALAGQLAALILLAAALAVGPARRPAEYVTLSASAVNAGSAAAAARPQIRLVFVETATERQMRDVLVRTRGRLVDGPSPAGTYTLELPAPAPAAAAQPDPAVRPATQAPSAAPKTPENTTRTAGAGETAPAPLAPRASFGEAADSVGTILAYLRSQPTIVQFAEPVAGTTSQLQPPAWPAAPVGRSTAQGSPAPPRP